MSSQFGKKFIHKRMEFHKSQNQGNIGLSFIIWERLLRYKLMTESQLGAMFKNYSLSLKLRIRNGH